MTRILRFWLTSAAVAAMVVGCGGTAADTSPTGEDNAYIAPDTETATLRISVLDHENRSGIGEAEVRIVNLNIVATPLKDYFGFYEAEVPLGEHTVEVSCPTHAVETRTVLVTEDFQEVQVELDPLNTYPTTSEPTSPEYEVVMSTATAANVPASIQKPCSGIADRAMVMISAERMKSVLIAPCTFCSSRCWSLSACFSGSGL